MPPVLARFSTLLLSLALATGCATSQTSIDRAFARLEPGACRALVGGVGLASASTTEPLAWHPADVDSASAHAESCDAVGPGVYDDNGGGEGSPPARLQDVAIVSWNVHVGGGDLGAFIAALRSGRVTSGRPVQHFVLLVQEAFRSGRDVPRDLAPGVDVPARIAPREADGGRVDVLTAARAAGLYVFYVPSMRNGHEPGRPAEDRGNAILSTLPLSDLTAIELPYARQRRVAAAATVTGFDEAGMPWRLRVASVHLDATASGRSLWIFSSQLRQRQAAHLLTALDGGVPTVVGADLNTWAGGASEPAVAALRRAFPDSDVSSESTFRFGLTLDYVFTRLPDDWQSEAVVLDDRFESDHHPLLATFRSTRRS